jgi:hypothetical protein
VDTGPLVYSPEPGEVASWKLKRLTAGAALIAVSALGFLLGAASMASGEAGDGGAAASVLTLLASLAIGVFGLRYLLLGLRGGPARVFESAVEAYFFKGVLSIPERRTVPLLRVEVGGTSRLARGTAVTSTGHAFPLPTAFMDRADLWYLGSLGSRPVAPGGREAKKRKERGEPVREPREPSPEIPDQGPPWPPIPPLPKDMPRPAPQAPPARAPPSIAPPSPVQSAMREGLPGPERPSVGTMGALAIPPFGTEPPSRPPSPTPPTPPDIEVDIEQLPEVTARPPPTRAPPHRPAARLREPPPVMEATSRGRAPVGEAEGAWEEDFELEELTPARGEPPASKGSPGEAPRKPSEGWDWEEI